MGKLNGFRQYHREVPEKKQLVNVSSTLTNSLSRSMMSHYRSKVLAAWTVVSLSLTRVVH